MLATTATRGLEIAVKKAFAVIAVASALAWPAHVAFAQTAPAGAGSETSDRTPEAKSPTPLPQTDAIGGKTSDRTPDKSAATGGMKMTQAECQALWKQADSAAAGSLSQTQAQSYASDFKGVDKDANGKLSSDEFLKGCEGGLIKSGASTGAGSGTSGSDDAPAPKN